MIKTIRDDVIKLERYVSAAFKYDELLDSIMKCGGYVFFSQLKKTYGENTARTLVQGAESELLISLSGYSNYKYVYLLSSATKYLSSKKLGTDETLATYKKISATPSDKTLFTSAFKWHLLHAGREMVVTETYEEYLKAYITCESKSLEELRLEREQYVGSNYEKIVAFKMIAKNLTKSHDSYAINIGKQLASDIIDYKNKVQEYDQRLLNYEEKLKNIDARIKKGMDLFRVSKMILVPEKKNQLRIMIFDVGDMKSIAGYMENVSAFEKGYGVRFSKIEFEFITYDKKRHSQFERKILRSKSFHPSKEITLGCYDPSMEYFGAIKDSKDIAEGFVKKKDQDKFDELKMSIEGNC